MNQLSPSQNRASITIRANSIVIPEHREVAGDTGELTESIRAFGVLQPIGIRRLHGNSAVLVWGFKRLKAVLSIDRDAQIEIIDLGEITDDEAAVAEIEENIRRHQYTQAERDAATARSVELRTAIIATRNTRPELSGQTVQKPTGRPPEAHAQAVRDEAAAQHVSPKTIERQIERIKAAKANRPRVLSKPTATGKVEKRKGTSWEALKKAYDGAGKTTQRRLLEYAAHDMPTAEWSKFVADLPGKTLPPQPDETAVVQ